MCSTSFSSFYTGATCIPAENRGLLSPTVQQQTAENPPSMVDFIWYCSSSLWSMSMVRTYFLKKIFRSWRELTPSITILQKQKSEKNIWVKDWKNINKTFSPNTIYFDKEVSKCVLSAQHHWGKGFWESSVKLHRLVTMPRSSEDVMVLGVQLLTKIFYFISHLNGCSFYQGFPSKIIWVKITWPIKTTC